METKRIITIIFIGCLIIGVLFFYTSWINPKIGCVDLQKVFNEFTLKKEYQQRAENMKMAQDKLLDSLKFQVSKMSNDLESIKNPSQAKVQEFNAKRDFYFEKKKEFDDRIESLSKDYDSKIKSQLNQYIQDFGKEKSYSVILGESGNGSIMYSEESLNITDEVILYINDKYLGKK